MTTATLELDDRIYFLGCEDEACIAEFGSGHHHGDQFKQWKAGLTPAQLASLGEQANAFQMPISWVASHIGVEAEDEPMTIPCGLCGKPTTRDTTYGDLCFRCCRADNE